MKALISAFALLSFVAAATVPVVALAETPPKHHVVKKHHVEHKKMAKKRHGKMSKTKVSGKRKTAPVNPPRG
jgi:hypothetical protein